MELFKYALATIYTPKPQPRSYDPGGVLLLCTPVVGHLSAAQLSKKSRSSSKPKRSYNNKKKTKNIITSDTESAESDNSSSEETETRPSSRGEHLAPLACLNEEIEQNHREPSPPRTQVSVPSGEGGESIPLKKKKAQKPSPPRTQVSEPRGEGGKAISLNEISHACLSQEIEQNEQKPSPPRTQVSEPRGEGSKAIPLNEIFSRFMALTLISQEIEQKDEDSSPPCTQVSEPRGEGVKSIPLREISHACQGLYKAPHSKGKCRGLEGTGLENTRSVAIPQPFVFPNRYASIDIDSDASYASLSESDSGMDSPSTTCTKVNVFPTEISNACLTEHSPVLTTLDSPNTPRTQVSIPRDESSDTMQAPSPTRTQVFTPRVEASARKHSIKHKDFRSKGQRQIIKEPIKPLLPVVLPQTLGSASAYKFYTVGRSYASVVRT